MPTPTELVEALVALDDMTFSQVYMDATHRRQREAHIPSIPPRGTTRDEFAEWLARRHLTIDVGTREIIYLTEGAPSQEVRFLEISPILDIDDTEPIHFQEASPDLENLPYTVLVADISPGQWARAQAGTTALPDGWDLQNHRVFGRQYWCP